MSNQQSKRYWIYNHIKQKKANPDIREAETLRVIDTFSVNWLINPLIHHLSTRCIIECVYMCTSIPVLSLILVLIICGIWRLHEKPGYSYPCRHDSNSIQVSGHLCAVVSWFLSISATILSNKEYSVTWIRCLHSTFILVPIWELQVAYPGFWNQVYMHKT